jgi:hypothetical protein
MQALFARPSIGGAVRAIFHASPALPVTASREAPG